MFSWQLFPWFEWTALRLEGRCPMSVIGADNSIEQILPAMPSRQEVTDELRRQWHPRPATEIVDAEDGLGRVLAADVRACFDFPPAQTSARDGIAVRFDDFAQGIPNARAWVRDVDYATADTGDDVPDAFDTVIQVEDLLFAGESGKMQGGTPGGCSFNDGFQIAVAPEKRGQHVNPAGSSFREGDVIVAAGARMTPERVAAAVSCGAHALEVLARPRVGIIPTGNELIPAGQTPRRGETVNSNATLIRAYSKLLGAEPVVHDIVLDTHDAIAAAADELLASCDIVLINAGSSKGSEDCGPIVLAERCSAVVSHGQRCAPGKPAMSGVTADGKVVCVIPGPPLACDTAIHWLLSSLVAQWYGHRPVERLVRARMASVVQAGPFEVWRRCTLQPGEDGVPEVRVIPMGLPSLGRADGILRTPAKNDLNPGDMADVLLLADGFGW